ncbi:FAD-dependent monooxygenase [Georgenia sp. Z1344]|uniref:FAD-dependent monooxygenase n=1 Tax=Georgenia sp. Z1344 TaxID=3416706 RepID=UPI003CF7A0BE
MQFHHDGYVTGDPRIQPAAGTGVDRPEKLPDRVDVLVVGAGPAGAVVAAQLSQFPTITTRIIDQRSDRLAVGHADGLQARSFEIFHAFGFADRLASEAHHVTELAFWNPDPADAGRIVRGRVAIDDEYGLSEFPHATVNQARVLDYFTEHMANAPTRMQVDRGHTLVSLRVTEDHEYPVEVGLEHPERGHRIVRACYLVGADGAHSAVRKMLGISFPGDRSNHAWGVLDLLADTDFPDVRKLTMVKSGSGASLMVIPREGGHLFRLYVDLGEVAEGDNRRVRNTPLEVAVAKAQEILHPYTLEVKDVVWYSVYEVGHRLAERFDDGAGGREPRVFIAGDACHTHSAKGGQGMNVSIQDGFNLGWKLGHVLDGRAPASLLATYDTERRAVAKNLIDFDKEWAALMARRSAELADPADIASYYMAAEEFRTGTATQYRSSVAIGPVPGSSAAHGYLVGRRFTFATVQRVSNGNTVRLGRSATADGRWRLYVFADRPGAGTRSSALTRFAAWLTESSASPFAMVPDGATPHAWFDCQLVLQQDHHAVDLAQVPRVFLPRVGPFGLVDRDGVHAALPDPDVFDERGIDRDGAVVVVRPDQHVALVSPLDDPAAVGRFFRGLRVAS